MTLAGRWAYRVRQFNKVWAGGLTPAERAETAAVLPPPLLPAFEAMRPEAQRHAFDVYATLRSEGWTHPDLLAAALLHDVAKGRLHPLHRAAWVLLGAVSARLRSRLALGTPLGAWLGLRDNQLHPGAGAALVAVAGGSPLLVRLVRDHYHSDPNDPLLCALQRADDGN